MSWLSSFFGGSKKVDTSYTGPRPVGSLADVQGGKDYYKTIQDRIAGRNVGFGEGYADKYSSPIIKNLRRGFTDYTMPELTSELSRMGRRKGSAGFSQIERAYGEQADKEGDIFSRLQMRNEDQGRSEVNDALERLGSYASNEANLMDRLSGFEYDARRNEIADARAGRKEDNERTGKVLATAGELALAPFTGGASLAGLANKSASAPYDLNSFDPRNYIGYGDSKTNLIQRVSQRNARLGQQGGRR